MKLHRAGSVGLVVAGVLGGAAFAAAPAHADIYGCSTSTVCIYEHTYRGGAKQSVSGYASYTDLNGSLHDRASSWTNACRSQGFAIGEWRNGRPYNGQLLPAGWYEDDLRTAGFNDMADYVAWA
ncbi:hypothetical protein [Sinomonas terrae]|uniref:Peptidase inhibitor family I36 n=1 Tax=Sinomonas terrae TaxID=2908838 RepID=A0ABS9U3M6_9MICC|nr:hypothetical protein [Sinomonas terrae]MCH6471303.1 hypothetical protein [Sinomonas terrae]